MSLLAVGAQDQYLTTAPEMTYFKQVYRRSTKFSMQSIRTTFLSDPVLSPSSSTTYTCKIGRFGDLLKDIFFSFETPPIYSNGTYRFRWIPKLGNYILLSYSVSVDSILLDKRWGDWLDVWNELSLSNDQKISYDKMTGNVNQLNNPQVTDNIVRIVKNKLEYQTYYIASDINTPSIPSTRIYVPLDFWFTKNPSLALPLIGLQYQTVNITVELRGLNELYQIYDDQFQGYLSPDKFKSLPAVASNIASGRLGLASPVNIQDFSKYGGGGSSFLSINAYLECNYIFLDTDERRYIASTSIDYLVERVSRSQTNGINTRYTIDLDLSNPVKEIIWTTQRSDVKDYNSFNNYTASQPEDLNTPILSSAGMLWNGVERLEEKPAAYFNLLQPYSFHTCSPREGIYVYSFALHPEKIQPSGTFNASMINTIQLYVNTNKYVPNNYDLNLNFITIGCTSTDQITGWITCDNTAGLYFNMPVTFEGSLPYPLNQYPYLYYVNKIDQQHNIFTISSISIGSISAPVTNVIVQPVTKPFKMNIPKQTPIDYTVTVYSIYYNIFRIISGTGGLVFAT